MTTRTTILLLLLSFPIHAFASPDAQGPAERWRFAAGFGAIGLGLATFTMSVVHADRMRVLEGRLDEKVAAAEQEQDLARYEVLSREVDEINERGEEAEAIHLATLVTGIVLTATGTALVIWDWVRQPSATATSDLQVSVSPLAPGLALRIDW